MPFNATDGSCTTTGALYQNTWATYNVQNQLTSTNALGISWSDTYDSAGDVFNDGGHNYIYDAEGRICQVYTTGVGWVGYVYDAAGNRVAKGTVTVPADCDISTNGFQPTYGYIVGPSGEQLTETQWLNNGWNQWNHTNVYAGGKLIGTYDTAGLHFYFDDPLGTRRAQANSAGVLEAVYQSLPFGDQYTSSGPGNDPTENHFTGKERDSESGNDYFGARYYNSATGRFLSPDWSAKVQPVPYAKLGNPQTLNLYAYVGNNPLSRTDPTGHADVAAECKGQKTCNKTVTDTVGIYHQDKKGNSVLEATLRVTTNFSLTTDARGNVNVSASSTVQQLSGAVKYSGSQLATMNKDIGTMQQAAVMMGFGSNTTQLVTAIGAVETRFGSDPLRAGMPSFMDPATNPMQLTGRNGAIRGELDHNVEGAMGVLDAAGRRSDFSPGTGPDDTYSHYSNGEPGTMANWKSTYSSISEQQQ